MSVNHPAMPPLAVKPDKKRPLLVTMLAILLGLASLGILGGGVFLSFSPSGGLPADLSGQLTIAGSASLKPLLDNLATAFSQNNPHLQIQVQPSDFGLGVVAVGDGAATIGSLTRELTAEEQANYPNLRLTPLAVDGLAVVTSPDVKLSTLSQAQVQGIFTGQITNFKEVGGPDAAIVVITRETGSEARAIFERLALGQDQKIFDQAFEVRSDEQFREGLAVIPGAIGYLPLSYLDDTVAAVPIDNVAPGLENIRNRTYPLTYNFYLATQKSPGLLARSFLNFIFSPAGQSIIAGRYEPIARPVAILDILQTLLAALILAMVGFVLARGLWTLQNWARTGLIFLLALVLIYLISLVVFPLAAQIFGGNETISLGAILRMVGLGLVKLVAYSFIPAGLIFGLIKLDEYFEETPGQRKFADQSIRYVLAASALSAIFIVFLIIVFTMLEAWPSIAQVGVGKMLIGTIWRPTDLEYGTLPMLVGSILSTVGAVILGVPLSLGTAILLAELAPRPVREVLHPAVELLAGIPSVVYGLFGMVVLAPVIRNVELPYNTGFGILNASIILAIMILPTVATISEDAIRSVPRYYKEGALALGSTHWQTIWSVMLPAARSGIIAAIILGIGRALGETMALIMVIGNSIAMPAPLDNNPLTIIFSSARTLTGNIAVEINYASGVHKSSLFFTGVMLLAMILVVNMIARYLMKERLSR